MSARQTFRELTYTMRPQDPHGDGKALRFETGEHGGDRWAVYVPLRIGGKIVGAGARGLLRPGRSMKWQIGAAAELI